MSKPAKVKGSKRAMAGPLGFVLGLGLFCGIGGFFTLAHLFHEDSQKLVTDMDRAREQHLPLSSADIEQRRIHPKESEDAGPLYRQAIAQYKVRFNDPVHPSAQRALNLAVTTLHEQNQRFQPIYQLIRRAITLPRCDLKLDYSKGYTWYTAISTPFPADAGMRSLMGGVALMGWEDSRNRNTEKVFEEAETLIAMAKHGQEYDLVHPGSWPIDADSQACQLLLRVLQLHWREPDIVRRVGEIANTVKFLDLYKLLETEFALGLDAVHNIKSLEEIGLDKGTPKAFSKTVDSLYQSPAVREAFEEKFVHVYIEFFHRLPASHTDWAKISQTLRAIRKELNSDNSIDAGVARALTPTYLGMADTFGSSETILRLLQVGVLLCLEHSRLGQFPQDLSPEAVQMVDPFGGKAFHYKPQKDGFTLYSIGPNLKDDGGRRWTPQNPKASDDITFRLGSARISGTIPRGSLGPPTNLRRIYNRGNVPQ